MQQSHYDGYDAPYGSTASSGTTVDHDQLFGHGRDDNLYGSDGNDNLDGGNGADLLRGDDSIDGGTGTDQVSYFHATGASRRRACLWRRWR